MLLGKQLTGTRGAFTSGIIYSDPAELVHAYVSFYPAKNKVLGGVSRSTSKQRGDQHPSPSTHFLTSAITPPSLTQPRGSTGDQQFDHHPARGTVGVSHAEAELRRAWPATSRTTRTGDSFIHWPGIVVAWMSISRQYTPLSSAVPIKATTDLLAKGTYPLHVARLLQAKARLADSASQSPPLRY
jgi:hypothetical protein